MIGVVADPADCLVIQELFELFKTPWEFCRRGRRYDVLLTCGGGDIDQDCARLALRFSRDNEPCAVSEGRGSANEEAYGLSYKGLRLPVYSRCRFFPNGNADLLADAATRKPAIHESRSKDTVVFRIGYDLFREVRHLLTVGQPASNAGCATLDLHIALIRDLIRSAGLPLIEVPPVPFGHRFAVCLTHDVDHPRLRNHKFDHTMFGFLYRALICSVADFIRGRISTVDVLGDWVAALKLPFVHLGLAKDPWSDFHRYVDIEGDSPSTFFVIPFKNRPGVRSEGVARQRRGAAYGASDLTNQLRGLLAGKREIALHGIDAWVDSTKGHEELAEIRSITGARDIGVRMHWLYFNEESPAVLERAGADYDTTVGYNETVGYRVGTSQVYKPLNATRLLELPLLIMDTALFYPTHMGLSRKDASAKMNEIVESVAAHGGCVTVNWHDRSIAPERLWTESYVNLIEDLRNRGAWFATASDATAWFRMRRSVTFEVDGSVNVQEMVPESLDRDLPSLCLRTHSPAFREPCDVVLTESQRNLVAQ
jgi:hypothetical protein